MTFRVGGNVTGGKISDVTSWHEPEALVKVYFTDGRVDVMNNAELHTLKQSPEHDSVRAFEYLKKDEYGYYYGSTIGDSWAVRIHEFHHKWIMYAAPARDGKISEGVTGGIKHTWNSWEDAMKDAEGYLKLED